MQPLDLDELTRLLEPDGPIAQQLPAYEFRNQQLEMMHIVADAFNAGNHLFVEAGTGTGKSPGLPAACRALGCAASGSRRHFHQHHQICKSSLMTKRLAAPQAQFVGAF